MIKKREIRKELLFGLRKSGEKAAKDYGLHDGSLLVLIEDLMPFLKKAGITKKEWLENLQ